MRIKIFTSGQRAPRWAEQGFEEYARRLPLHLKPELICVAPTGKRARRADDARKRAEEGEHLLRRVGTSRSIALERQGTPITSEQFAQSLLDWQIDGNDVAFLIGGADGLAPSVHERADAVWSLSTLVFAHQLVPLLLAEQLYRAFSISTGGPYHRGDPVAGVKKFGQRRR